MATGLGLRGTKIGVHIMSKMKQVDKRFNRRVSTLHSLVSKKIKPVKSAQKVFHKC